MKTPSRRSLTISDKLRFGPNAEVRVKSTDGTEKVGTPVVVDSNGDIVLGTGEQVVTSSPPTFEVFDDFLDAAIDTTNNWIVFEGSDGGATVGVTITAPEGAINMGSGGAGSTNDKSVLGLILVAKGSLVSLGTTVFETRVSFDQTTGTSWGFGLGDVLPAATEIANYKVNSGTVTDDAGIADAVSFVFSTDATATTLWQACSTNGSTVGNAAAEESLVVGPTADTYDVLRIEVDSNGDARFYINGVLRLTRLLAVATTAILIPYIWGDSGDDADVATVVTNDYIKFSGTRPSSNA